MMHFLTLVIFNMVYFLCNIYPKHIIEIGSPLSVVAIIFNLVYYVFFALFLFFALNKNKKLFFTHLVSPVNKTVRRTVFTRILLICVLQLFFEILVLFLFSFLNENILYIIDLFSVLGWIAFYIICVGKEGNVFCQRKSLILVAVLTILLILTNYSNYGIINTCALTTSKYTNNAATAVETIINSKFIFQVKNLLIDTVCGTLLFAAHILFNKTNVVREKSGKSKQGIRFVLFLICAFILVGIKSAFVPVNCISGIDQKGSETQNYTSSNSFYANTKTTVITRVDSNLLKQVVFQNTKNQLYYGEALILEYDSSDAISANTYEKIGNQITIKDCFKKIDGEVTFYLYKNEVICFLHNGTPVAIYSDNLQENHSEYLTAIYKNLIENNNWNFFEQGTKYLLKHDIGFIKPYLQRFSVGDFKQEELKALDEMSFNRQYIQSLSQNLMSDH